MLKQKEVDDNDKMVIKNDNENNQLSWLSQFRIISNYDSNYNYSSI